MPRSRLMIPVSRVRWAQAHWSMTRVLLRQVRTALREFRYPLAVLAAAIFGGGWLYGELLVQAGYPRIAPVDLPYTMLALMLFESPGSMPGEPQLMVFWYLMPGIGAYVAARGGFDFVRLFISRSETHRSWEEAMASTYRNHVIVLGVGHLGTRVIRSLVQMGFDVVAIDSKLDAAKTDELDQLGVRLVNGDGRMANTLETAGIRHAAALIVCTSNDHMNLELTMRARDLNPALRIVVRMWDDQFAAQIRRFMNVEAVMSATDLAAPAFAGMAVGIEIAQTMTIGGADFSMIRLEVVPGSFLDGARVDALQDQEDMDIVLHGRGADVRVHPPDDTVIRGGDTLVIFAQHSKITDVVARNQGRRVVSR